MDVFIFRSVADDLCIGFTQDKTGANLPSEFAPWQPAHHATLPPQVDAISISESDSVLAMIRMNGFYVAHGDPPNVVRTRFGRRGWQGTPSGPTIKLFRIDR